MTGPHPSARTFLAGLAAVSFAAFALLAAVFWLGTNRNEEAGPVPEWARLSGDAASAKVLPFAVVAIAGGLLLAGRWRESRFLLLAVAGAGVLMYAARVLLQAFGADDDGGRMSDYPSGHATATSAFAVALVVLVWSASRSAAARGVALALAAASVALVGWARIEAGGHTLLDVLGGAALGTCCVAVCALTVPPTAAGTFRRVPALVALLAIGLTGFVLLAVLYDRESLGGLDEEIAEEIAASMPAGLEWLARPFSWLGGWIGLTALGVVGSVLLLRLRAWLDLAFFLLAVAGSQLAVLVLKNAFDRPRPDVGSAISLPGSSAFPSGHATGGVAAFGAAAVFAAERLDSVRARVWLWSGTIVLGAGVGASRVVLNVHFVTDVVAGWCLGLAWLAGLLLVREAIRARRQPRAPREVGSPPLGRGG